jgi:hypothetical protein
MSNMYYDVSFQDTTVSVTSGACSTKVSVSVIIIIIIIITHRRKLKKYDVGVASNADVS